MFSSSFFREHKIGDTNERVTNFRFKWTFVRARLCCRVGMMKLCIFVHLFCKYGIGINCVLAVDRVILTGENVAKCKHLNVHYSPTALIQPH